MMDFHEEMSSSKYIPIACATYDLFEAAAVQRSPLRLTVRSHATSLDVLILDLFSRNKAEFVKVKDVHSGQEHVFRLDDIESVTDLNTMKVYSTDTC